MCRLFRSCSVFLVGMRASASGKFYYLRALGLEIHLKNVATRVFTISKSRKKVAVMAGAQSVSNT